MTGEFQYFKPVQTDSLIYMFYLKVFYFPIHIYI